MVGYALGAPELRRSSPGHYVYLLYFFLPANIFIYGVNDYWDEDTDKLNKKKDERELRVTDRDKRRLIWILWATVGVSAVLMVFQDNVERILFLIFLSLSYFYSARPLRFKSIPILDFSSNMLYIMPGIFAYYLAGGQLPPLLLVLAGYFHIAAMHLFSAVPDIECDRRAGIRTTAVVLGERRSLMLVAAFWSVFSALVIYLTDLHPLSILVLMFPAFPLALLIDRGKDINKLYWRLPYVNNLLGGLLFSVVVLGLALQS